MRGNIAVGVALLVALVEAPSAAVNGQDGPSYEKLASVDGSNTRLTVSCCCGTGGFILPGDKIVEGEVACRFDTLSFRIAGDGICVAEAGRGEDAKLWRVDKNLWMSKPRAFTGEPGLECSYTSVVYLTRTNDHWEYRETRAYSWDGAACSKRLAPAQCATMERECARLRKEKAEVIYVHNPRRLVIQPVRCERLYLE